jgi:hypothetical protein
MIDDLKGKPTVKFDLSEIDPDYLCFLWQQADEKNMTVDELLNAERRGDVDLLPDYSNLSSAFPIGELAKSIALTIDSTDFKLKMAVKRLAHKSGMSVDAWCAEAIVTQVMVEEQEAMTDPLTGLYLKESK